MLRIDHAPSVGTLSAAAITKAYGSRAVLDGVSVVVAPGTRLGVVGPNGIGKSTLLRILAGIEEPDAGRVLRSPGTLRVGYLPQEPDAAAGETLLESIARRTGVATAEADVDRLVRALAEDASLAADYSDALDRYLALGGDDLRPRAEALLDELGLDPARLGVAVADLSAGQQARGQLAAILLSRFDVMLLDEPTNNLDFEGLDLLESFLYVLPAGVAVVSHDRAFLDRTVHRILELREDDLTGTEYAGGWSDYVHQREIARRHQAESFEKYTGERARLQERLRTQRQWAVQGVAKEKRSPRDNDKAQRDFRINRTEKQASKVRATERALERLESVDKPWEPWRLRLHIAPRSRSGDVVARLRRAVVRRGTFALGPVDLEIGSGERVAILGPNGAGKTTLLRAILGSLPLAEGERYVGPSVVVGEMDQARTTFDTDATLLDAFERATGLVPGEARTLLAKFGLGAGHVTRAASSLSPGERSRAVLATLVARGVNCLVLDEPTNHLDLPAIEQLEQVLDDFPGTILIVTHDRWLLDRVALTSTIEVRPQGAHSSLVEGLRGGGIGGAVLPPRS